MSLFENDFYRWRETYFAFIDAERRPSAEAFRRGILQLDRGLEVQSLSAGEDDRFESATLLAPADQAAMDITYTEGDDVTAEIVELIDEVDRTALTDEENEKLRQMAVCSGRFEIYHFEELGADGDEEEVFDPGALLIVLDLLNDLCAAVGFDPQGGAIL